MCDAIDGACADGVAASAMSNDPHLYEIWAPPGRRQRAHRHRTDHRDRDRNHSRNHGVRAKHIFRPTGNTLRCPAAMQRSVAAAGPAAKIAPPGHEAVSEARCAAHHRVIVRNPKCGARLRRDRLHSTRPSRTVVHSSSIARTAATFKSRSAPAALPEDRSAPAARYPEDSRAARR